MLKIYSKKITNKISLNKISLNKKHIYLVPLSIFTSYHMSNYIFDSLSIFYTACYI